MIRWTWLVMGACSSPSAVDESPSTTAPPRATGDPLAPGEADPCLVPSLLLGTGASTYTPVADGDDVTMVFGPQGGWHLDVAALVLGTGQIASVQPALELADGTSLTLNQPPTTLAMRPAEPCGHTFFGIRALFADNALPDDAVAYVCGLDGSSATLTVTVRDDSNSIALIESVTVILRADPIQECGNA